MTKFWILKEYEGVNYGFFVVIDNKYMSGCPMAGTDNDNETVTLTTLSDLHLYVPKNINDMVDVKLVAIPQQHIIMVKCLFNKNIKLENLPVKIIAHFNYMCQDKRHETSDFIYETLLQKYVRSTSCEYKETKYMSCKTGRASHIITHPIFYFKNNLNKFFIL